MIRSGTRDSRSRFKKRYLLRISIFSNPTFNHAKLWSHKITVPSVPSLCHISTLRKHLDLKTKDLYWIIGKHSPFSLTNKLLIYKEILEPVWTYGIELWGCASSSSSHTAKIQRYQSKLLRFITNAPRFVTNQTLHQDLCIATVLRVFQEKAAAHYHTLSLHPNPLMGPLTDQPKQRRLKHNWTFDGIN